MIDKLYVYFTDFTITAANLLGITYEDFNALIFCVLWPLITLVLILLYAYQWRKLKNRETYDF